MPFGAPEDEDLGATGAPGASLLQGAIDRRAFLGLTLGAAFTLGTGSSAFAAAFAGLPERRIRLRNIHTGDSFDGIYWRNGKYQRPAIKRLSWVLRDYRANKVKMFDPHLFDLLDAVARRMGSHEPFQVVSGYRTLATNNAKRRHDHDVARNSYHTRAQAIDIFLPDRSVQGVQKVALTMRAGGVGYYPDSGFVHLDTGPVRTW
jgi:uncharacterized protein YcbK (DUF882 family)